MRTPRIAIAMVLTGLALAGCEERPLRTTPEGPVLPLDHGTMPISRVTNRLSLQQLRGTLPALMGVDTAGAPITWKVGATTEGLTAFASALGEPDYIQVTDENLEPSPMYAKFMDDLARDVCNRSLTADLSRSEMAQRVLLRHVAPTDTVATNPTGVNQNLRYLKLRFHGVKVPVTEDAAIAGLRTLFANAASASGASGSTAVREGWRAVCVALLTAPEFHFY